MNFKKHALIILLSLNLYANEEIFLLESMNFTLENDGIVRNDSDYTHGAKISMLYYRGDTSKSWLNIPFTSYESSHNFISFALANHIYTPADLNETDLIRDDRPYAGYSYIEIALHQSTQTTLDSLTLELGIVGAASGMQELHKQYHNLGGLTKTNGWQNQIKNEPIFQLNYMRKWRHDTGDVYGFETIFVPYAGFDLGNRSIRASGGGLYRLGRNIPSDYGVNIINEGSYSSMPTHSKSVVNSRSKESLYMNLTLGASLVARDIFLDGNSFKDSHSVDKNFATSYVSTGVTYRYENISVDFLHTYYTKEYKEREIHKRYKGFSSLIFTYNFE